MPRSPSHARRPARLIALLAIILGSLPAGTGGAAAPLYTVLREQPVFVSGPHIQGTATGMSWSYDFDVRETGYRLRVGVDHPVIADIYTANLYNPAGSLVQTFTPGDGLYSAEVAVTPSIGVWRVRVSATDVEDSAFRVRVKLEAQAPSLGSGPDVLPNLQVLPPHEPTFIAPISNGTTGGEPQPLDVMGVHPLSCHPEEHAEEQAIKCLRFAFGVKNTGLGPMQLSHPGNPPLDQPLTQRVLRLNGSSYNREAGLARYHKTHAHYHHHEAVGLRLYKVTNTATGASEAAGAEHRKGFAHRDELLREWDTFYPTLNNATGFGLKPGWADIYEWDRPGNYIDFGLNGDGHYVIRMTADPSNGILESNEVDNAGYTYLKVTGERIDMLESGRGRDPWDPCKIVVGFGGHPDPEPASPRPDTCPPDSTE